jgi:hypothetical protein
MAVPEMNRDIASELIAMKAEDLRVREELARDGSLFDGYHPHLEALHKKNATRLREFIQWADENRVALLTTRSYY